jgi:hypothetical protein
MDLMSNVMLCGADYDNDGAFDIADIHDINILM